MSTKILSAEYVRMDGTRGRIDGGTLESMTENLNRIRSEGGRVSWVSDAIILGVPSFVNNTAPNRPNDDILVMPKMSFATNALETPGGSGTGLNSPDAISQPLPSFAGAEGGGAAPLAVDNGDEPYEMPTMNFDRTADNRQPANVGGSQAEETLGLPSMEFAPTTKRRKRA